MLFKKQNLSHKLFLSLFLVLSLLFFAACSSSSADGGGESSTEDVEHEEEGEHEEGEHEEGDEHNEDEHQEEERVPNEGALIRITAPGDNTTFSADEDIVVEVEVQQFELGEDGNHWHIYVDGTSWAMVVGKDTDEAPREIKKAAMTTMCVLRPRLIRSSSTNSR